MERQLGQGQQMAGHAVATMNLRHTVITSVNRDELPDGGAAVWAETIRQIRLQSPGTSVEVLIPDFCGDWDALQKVLDESPDILNHNIESVPRLYRVVRPQAKYHRALRLLQISKGQGFVTKTGMMLGLGEEEHEIDAVIDDLVAIGCDILTLGQYLQPTAKHLPVVRWVHPEEFAEWKRRGEERGRGWHRLEPPGRGSAEGRQRRVVEGVIGNQQVGYVEVIGIVAGAVPLAE